MRYWLFKSEPETFSIEKLENLPTQTTVWDGVRNYQVRNMLRDDIKKGDLGFFYHSSCKEPAIVGIVEVIKAGYPDPSAFDSKSRYFDPKSQLDKPTWYAVDLKLIQKLATPIPLQSLRQNEKLAEMILLKKGNRLSILPVQIKEWNEVLEKSN